MIGLDLNLVPVQVRKDLQYTGIVGKPKTGYAVPELIAAIETFLGWNNVNEAFLAGAGNLGTALLGHERFSNFGLRIVAAFDTDPEKVGQWVHGKMVLPLDKLADLAKRMSIHLGIITAPAESRPVDCGRDGCRRHSGHLELCAGAAEVAGRNHCPQRRSLLVAGFAFVEAGTAIQCSIPTRWGLALMATAHVAVDRAGKFRKVCGILERHGYRPSGLIPILQAVQLEYQYLPEEVLTFVATSLDLPPARVFGVATFYAHFALEPKGKHVIGFVTERRAT